MTVDAAAEMVIDVLRRHHLHLTDA
jgi:hypothetical protein